MVAAGQIPQSWLSTATTITATGRLVGVIGLRDRIHITIELPADQQIERVKDTP